MPHRLALVLLSFVMFAAGCSAPATSRSDGSSPPSLRFVVLGDNQPPGTEMLGQPEVFQRIVDEVAVMRPDLLLHLGDHISGYAADMDLVKRMWDEYFAVTAAWTMPVHHAAGNHDIWDVRSETLWKERVGGLYHAFDQGGCHFIVLDSEDQAHPGRITGEQLAWLRRDLAAHGNKGPIFVSLHQPLWLALDWRTFQASDWDRDVHPLLRQHRVSAVFAGHHHQYATSEKDGVRYILSGGGGGPIDSENGQLAQGDFHHYCVVTVRGTSVAIEVRRPGESAALPEESVVYDEIPYVKRSHGLWRLQAQAMARRQEGRFLEASAAWMQVLVQAGGEFSGGAKLLAREIERDLRSAGRLDDFAGCLAQLSVIFPGEPFTAWRDLTLAQLALERGDDAGALALYATLLGRYPADAAVTGQVFNDLALHRRPAGMVKIEAETFSGQGGGAVTVAKLVRASGSALSKWDNPGHWLEWKADVPADGAYYLIFRFAQGFQDKTGTNRVLSIDGQELERGFFWYTGGWARGSDDWACRLLTGTDGAPHILTLGQGQHSLRLEAPPGKPKGLNLDYLLLVPAFTIAPAK